MKRRLLSEIRGWSGLTAGTLVLALDYDGTLVPIYQKPEQAHPDSELLSLLRDLANTCTVIILTGRVRKDMERWIPEPAIAIVASHGAEWRHRGLWKPLLRTHETRSPLTALVARLEEAFRDTSGVIVEVKDFTVAFHYRLVRAGCQADLLYRFENVIGPWVERNKSYEILDGKFVKEIRPQGLDKGKALRRAREMLNTVRTPVLAMGDDRTDEDMFQSLSHQDLSILVGVGTTSAAVRLSDFQEARNLLRWILRIRQKSGDRRQKSG